MDSLDFAQGNERFLVTGSEGCIGSWVVACLARAGAPVIAMDLRADGRRLRRILDEELLEQVVCVSEDITADGAIERLVDEHAVTRIIHLAALQVPFVAADLVLGGRVNVVGTLRVFEAARRSGEVRGVSYASSSAVFGMEDPARPDTLYGAFKHCNEESARFYARDYETPTVGLRPCVVYGPNRDQGLTSAITHAMRAAVLGIPYRVPFGGSVDLQYAEDVARAFIRCAMVPADRALVFDLHGDLLSVADVLAAIKRELPGASELLSHAEDPIPSKADFDDGPLRAFAGELPKTTFEEGTRATLEVFRRQRDAGTLTPDDIVAPEGAAR